MNLNTLFLIYAFLGFLIVLFNKNIANFFYNLVLYYTDKLRLNELFLFKVDTNNKNSLFFLMRSFILMFALAIISLTLYKIYN